MANKKITELSQVTTLPDEAVFTAVDSTRASGDQNVKITKSDLASDIGGGANLEKDVNQVGHGFSAGQVIRLDGGTYVLAQADAVANANAISFVTEVVNVDNFKVQSESYISVNLGLSNGDEAFLSTTVAGGIQTTKPSNGEVNVYLGQQTPQGFLISISTGFVVGSGGSGGVDDGVIYIKTTDNPQVIYDNAPSGSHLRFVAGLHEWGVNNNSRTQDSILYCDKPMAIELLAGATLKRADNTSTIQSGAEVVDNQDSYTLNDLSVGSNTNYTGTDVLDLYVQIDGGGSPNTFTWGRRVNSVNTPVQTNVSITGGQQLLEEGIYIEFGATTGHGVNDLWYVCAGGQAQYGIRVGEGFHINYIEDVTIFGDGVVDMNIANNVSTSRLVADISSCLLVNGRCRNITIKDITAKNCHRTIMAYGEYDGDFSDSGSIVPGGDFFDIQHLNILNTNNLNTDQNGFGILIGHPQHRGITQFVRCNNNYVDVTETGIEPNYCLREYEVKENTIVHRNRDYGIHIWRRSDNGVIKDNILQNDESGTLNCVQGPERPGNWDLAQNITAEDNFNLNTGKQEPYPPLDAGNSADDPLANMIANYSLDGDSLEDLGVVSGIDGIDTDITYSSDYAGFNGSTSIIEVPDNDVFSFTNGVDDLPFTIAFKVWHDDTSSSFFVAKIKDDDSSAEYAFAFFSTQLWFRIFDGVQAVNLSIRTSGGYTPATGQWLDMACTYDGSKTNAGMKMYLNGSLITTTVDQNGGTYTGMQNTPAEVAFGKTLWTSAHQLNGRMKDIRFYNEEKSATGIAAIAALP